MTSSFQQSERAQTWMLLSMAVLLGLASYVKHQQQPVKPASIVREEVRRA